MRKFLSILIAGSMAFEALLVPVSAMAQTTSSTDVSAMIAQLEAQIRTLQTQIEALRAARAQVASTTQQTIQLIRQLREGMSGDDVRLLQILLASDLEIYPDVLITGFFGKKTAEAVRRFQRKNGLPGIGLVGPLTLEKLMKLLNERGLNQENDDDDEDHDGDRKDKRLCVKVSPGHQIAPGWLRKNNGERPIVPVCQDLPRGIKDKLDDDDDRNNGRGDTTAPMISGVMATSTSAIGTTIKWSTNEFATSWVWYGTSTPLANINGSNVTTKNHSVNLTGLQASTTYQYVVVSKDNSGNTATSSQQSFTTN